MKLNKVFRLGMAVALVAVLIIGTASTYKGNNRGKEARRGNRQGFHGKEMMDLTDGQKEQIKTLKLNFVKEITPIKNELGIKHASLKAVSIGDNVNVKEVNNLIEEIGELKIEIEKKHFAHQQSVRKLLNDEQKIMFDAHAGRLHQKEGHRDMHEGNRRFMHKKHGAICQGEVESMEE